MKRWLSMILVLVLCCGCLPQSASAQTVGTEELLLGLVEYLFSGAENGLEVAVEQPNGVRNVFTYTPDEEGGGTAALTMPEFSFGLDAEGMYIGEDGQYVGVRMDELMSFLLQGTTGLSHIPRFAAEDGMLVVELLQTLWQSAAEEAVQVGLFGDDNGSGIIKMKIDVDKLASSTAAAVERLLDERGEDIDALLKEYGALIG